MVGLGSSANDEGMGEATLPVGVVGVEIGEEGSHEAAHRLQDGPSTAVSAAEAITPENGDACPPARGVPRGEGVRRERDPLEARPGVFRTPCDDSRYRLGEGLHLGVVGAQIHGTGR